MCAALQPLGRALPALPLLACAACHRGSLLAFSPFPRAKLAAFLSYRQLQTRGATVAGVLCRTWCVRVGSSEKWKNTTPALPSARRKP